MSEDYQRTVGPWDDEEQATVAFDTAISGDRRFSHVYTEVSGRYRSPIEFDEIKPLRIDRVLMPSRELCQAGWVHGPIGVEIKAPGKKLGRAISQCIDYGRCTFEVKPGFHVPLGFVFLFPSRPFKGDIASVAVQNRVGSGNVTPHGKLVLFRASAVVASISEPHRNFIELSKMGSR